MEREEHTASSPGPWAFVKPVHCQAWHQLGTSNKNLSPVHPWATFCQSTSFLSLGKKGETVPGFQSVSLEAEESKPETQGLWQWIDSGGYGEQERGTRITHQPLSFLFEASAPGNSPQMVTDWGQQHCSPQLTRHLTCSASDF